jgi:hypothetical protein
MPITTSRLGLAILIAASLPLAACGSSSNPSANASGGGTTPDPAAYTKALRFASCMRSHGVPNFPDPTSNGSGGMVVRKTPGSTEVNGVTVNGPAFQSAMTACRSYLPNGGQPRPLSEARRKQMLAFSQCMRSHGISSFPDPTFGHNGGASLLIPSSSGIDPNSPTFKTASQACGSILGAAKGGPIGP